MYEFDEVCYCLMFRLISQTPLQFAQKIARSAVLLPQRPLAVMHSCVALKPDLSGVCVIEVDITFHTTEILTWTPFYTTFPVGKISLPKFQRVKAN